MHKDCVDTREILSINGISIRYISKNFEALNIFCLQKILGWEADMSAGESLLLWPTLTHTASSQCKSKLIICSEGSNSFWGGNPPPVAPGLHPIELRTTHDPSVYTPDWQMRSAGSKYVMNGASINFNRVHCAL